MVAGALTNVRGRSSKATLETFSGSVALESVSESFFRFERVSNRMPARRSADRALLNPHSVAPTCLLSLTKRRLTRNAQYPDTFRTHELKSIIGKKRNNGNHTEIFLIRVWTQTVKNGRIHTLQTLTLERWLKSNIRAIAKDDNYQNNKKKTRNKKV